MKSFRAVLLIPVFLFIAGAVLADTAGITPLMKKRAAEFKKANKQSQRLFIRLSWDTGMHVWNGKPGALAERLQLLGATDVMIELDRDKFFDGTKVSENYSGRCRKLVRELVKRKIRAWGQVVNYDIFITEKHSRGWFSSEENKAVNFRLEALKKFNAADPASGFSGVIIEAQPHLMDGNSRFTPKNMLYQWDPKSYGKGLDNDILIQRMFNSVAHALTKNSIPVGFLTSAEYADKALQGQLSVGKVRDFLKYGNFVILECFSSRYQTIARLASSELRSSIKPKSVFIGVYTDYKVYGSKAKKIGLNSRSWRTFIKSLTNINKRAAAHKAFAGLYFDDYDGIEQIWDTTK